MSIIKHSLTLFGCLVLVAARGPIDHENEVRLPVGQAMSLKAEDAKIIVIEQGAAVLAPFEEMAVQRLWSDSGKYEVGSVGATPGKSGIPLAPAIDTETVKFKLVEFPAGQTLLAVENGYDRGLVYTAKIMGGGHITETTVCLVMPRRRTIEHWPYAMNALQLSGFRLVQWSKGDNIPCA